MRPMEYSNRSSIFRYIPWRSKTNILLHLLGKGQMGLLQRSAPVITCGTLPSTLWFCASPLRSPGSSPQAPSPTLCPALFSPVLISASAHPLGKQEHTRFQALHGLAKSHSCKRQANAKPKPVSASATVSEFRLQQMGQGQRASPSTASGHP